VRIVNLLIRVQRIALVAGLFFFVFFFLLVIIGRANTAKDPIKATTPPSFDGIDRKIA